MKTVMRGSRAMRGVLSCLSALALLAGARTASLAQVGQPWAWGWNKYYQLGDGTTTDRPAPINLSSLSGVMQVSGGSWHSFVLNADGTLWAWGKNNEGELAIGTKDWKGSPFKIPTISGVMHIYAGQNHNLAVKSDGSVWSWGYNGYAVLGDGTGMDRWSPVKVYGLSGIVQLSGGENHSIALKSDGTVWTWGRNDDGQLGDRTSDIWTAVPRKVPGLKDVVQISGGRWHALGDGTSTDRHTPVQTLNLTNQTYIDGGGDFGLSVQAVVLNTAVTTKNVTMQYAKPTSLSSTLVDQRGFPLLFQPLVFKMGNTTLSAKESVPAPPECQPSPFRIPPSFSWGSTP